jgi:hypothetical protein
MISERQKFLATVDESADRFRHASNRRLFLSAAGAVVGLGLIALGTSLSSNTNVPARPAAAAVQSSAPVISH